MRTVLWNPKLFWLKFPATRAATHALFCPSGSATDASTLADAAHAIAVNLEMADIDMAMADVAPANATTVADVPAGAVTVVDVAELMLERERLAMDREALRSFVVERHYVRGPEFSEDDYWSWRRAFDLQANMLRNICDQATDIDDLAHGTDLEASVDASMNDMITELKEAVKVSREIVASSRRGTLIAASSRGSGTNR